MRTYTATFAALSIAGCAATKPERDLPQYQWADAGTALRLMQQRDGVVDTFSATCGLLIEVKGKQVELTGAVAADPPDRLRLRAWKLSSAVLDVTLNPDGLFLYKKKRDETDSAVEQLSHDRFVAALTLLPGFGENAGWQTGGAENDREFSITKPAEEHGAVIECYVDKTTFTRTRCDYRASDGGVSQTLFFSSYRSVGDTVWPMRLEIRGDFGDVDLWFTDIDVNEELSPRAFTPPRRAIKQQ